MEIDEVSAIWLPCHLVDLEVLSLLALPSSPSRQIDTDAEQVIRFNFIFF